MTIERVQAESLEQLRQRTSSKWRTFDADVLPLPVAEMDVPIPAVIKTVLREAIEHNDIGYPRGTAEIGAAFAAFARERWGWDAPVGTLVPTTDVGVGIVELLRRLIEPGDGVIVTTPVYPPFWTLPPEAGATLVPVPLAGDIDAGWSLDLAAIDAALAAGARVVLLCHPHNPVGRVHRPAELAELAEIADRHGATVISDEIHAPLTFAEAEFVPFLAVSETARRVGVAITSASKAWNLAGLKFAFLLSASPEGDALLASLPEAVGSRVSILGLKAQVEAFRAGGPWLDGAIELLDANRVLLGELLAAHLPEARYRAPEASYLAWVDLSAYGLGDDPAERILAEARVAFGSGITFAPDAGIGHVRINFGTSPEILTEAIERVAALLNRERAAAEAGDGSRA
ncbi:MalY/PatB family protein [Leucobacter sp. M11]|uniref:MalY/PatB family protein n=1 Tax=Leucobacter sp. M11 TaxID=2993565 RepID=UPI002D7FF90B|nr:aminotransferase class I/II-fold pyridoxal phosphate-dependent enzyme [Leucobacter sp. M11]MEB4615034.1 aminotransferase class I/II-fold pyridoxal phosphate-dependent enzyme [Leucobacter sp. M11]